MTNKQKDLDGPVRITQDNTSKLYVTNAENESYRIGLKALSKYNRLAYKEIIFNILPNIRIGNFLGETSDGIHYIITLPCDEKFSKIHGQVYLHYEISDHSVTMTSLEPSQILIKLHRKLVNICDGVPITDNKDLFKLHLYNCMKGDK